MVDGLAPEVPAQPKDGLGEALAHADHVAAVALPRGRRVRQVAFDHEPEREGRQRQKVNHCRRGQRHTSAAAGPARQGPGNQQGDHGVAQREREQRPLHAKGGQ